MSKAERLIPNRFASVRSVRNSASVTLAQTSRPYFSLGGFGGRPILLFLRFMATVYFRYNQKSRRKSLKFSGPNASFPFNLVRSRPDVRKDPPCKPYRMPRHRDRRRQLVP